MIISSWNVNSVRARLGHVIDWLKELNPHVMLLQETKVVNADFPRDALEDLGYNVAVHGEKSYNGVAILSKSPIENLAYTFPGIPNQDCRYIEAAISYRPGLVVNIASIYVINGQDLSSPKFAQKKIFLSAFCEYLQSKATMDEMFIVGGDYNVAPTDDDVAYPERWRGKILCSEDERKLIADIKATGFYDPLAGGCFAQCENESENKEWNKNKNEGENKNKNENKNDNKEENRKDNKNGNKNAFTWWDYKTFARDKNNGLRIDYFFLSPNAMKVYSMGEAVKAERLKEKTSDHVPIWIKLDVI